MRVAKLNVGQRYVAGIRDFDVEADLVTDLNRVGIVNASQLHRQSQGRLHDLCVQVRSLGCNVIARGSGRDPHTATLHGTTLQVEQLRSTWWQLVDSPFNVRTNHSLSASKHFECLRHFGRHDDILRHEITGIGHFDLVVECRANSSHRRTDNPNGESRGAPRDTRNALTDNNRLPVESR